MTLDANDFSWKEIDSGKEFKIKMQDKYENHPLDLLHIFLYGDIYLVNHKNEPYEFLVNGKEYCLISKASPYGFLIAPKTAVILVEPYNIEVSYYIIHDYTYKIDGKAIEYIEMGSDLKEAISKEEQMI